jgi:8-oxo-dGTP pyrophosphatase MutT (NUDIX family)
MNCPSAFAAPLDPLMSRLSTPPKILSSGIVVVHFDGDRYRLLAVRTYDVWDFPKALVGESEDPLEVALREAREGVALDELEFTWDEAFRETVASEDGSVSRYYLGESKSAAVSLRVPPGDAGLEDFEYRWVTPEEAEDILPPRLELVLQWVIRQLASGPK